MNSALQCRDTDELQSLVLAATRFSEADGQPASKSSTKSVGQSDVAQRPTENPNLLNTVLSN